MSQIKPHQGIYDAVTFLVSEIFHSAETMYFLLFGFNCNGPLEAGLRHIDGIAYVEDGRCAAGSHPKSGIIMYVDVA